MRESGSTLIAIIIILEGVCEQAEHVKLPKEMENDVTMKTRNNLCRNIGVHTKPLNGVSIRKNVSCGSFYNTEAEKCTTLFIFHINLEVVISCTSRKNQINK